MSETLVRMPKLADTLVEGTLAQWLKRVGDVVRQGEPLASIETDKVTTELTSPAAGTLLEVLVSDGQTVPIETPIARIAGHATSCSPSWWSVSCRSKFSQARWSATALSRSPSGKVSSARRNRARSRRTARWMILFMLMVEAMRPR
jgi:pyruvate/2-oxoglutarate dehydrogenase complex dihydrolipoamide acyltransferase (E2) component